MLQIDQDDAEHFEQNMRQEQEVIESSLFRTHDICLPFTWGGANTGRWRVRATNEKGASEWPAWRHVSFSN